YGMRVVAASARQMLISAAADKWNVPASQLTTENSFVIHKKTGKKLRYGELATSATEYSASASPVLKNPDQYKIVGKPTQRLDIPGKVDGSFQYGMDLELPDMRYVAMKASPIHGGKLVSADTAAALKVSGVEKVIKLKSSVAVVAKSFWQAGKGLEAAAPEYAPGKQKVVSTSSIAELHKAALNSGKRRTQHEIGDAKTAIKTGKIFEAEYEAPFLHHAAMEPINVTAQYKNGHLTVWAGSQNPLDAKSRVAELSGLSIDNITFKPMHTGGAFGRRGPRMNIHIYLEPAIQAAKEMSPKPVKLIWSREEDFAQGNFRPRTETKIKVSLDGNGKPLSWAQVFIDGANVPDVQILIPYDIPNQLMESVDGQTHVQTGPWRSVNHSQHGFWAESFIDELAHNQKQDPLQYRLDLLKKGSRSYNVLKLAEEKSEWKTPVPAGVGRGVALVESFGSIVAHVVEVKMDETGREPRITRVTSVADCGLAVNPESAKQQIEGGFLMGAGAALGEEITIEDGKVVQENFPDYELMTLAKTPARMDVHFINSGAKWGGLGEPGLPPAAPAVSNAIFLLTGKRMRSMPFSKALANDKLAEVAN
ncbi:MAG: xanthine dehydrogenase family protein molybdopterin-binding subunit, partial [Methyloligellaceae bacterium]